MTHPAEEDPPTIDENVAAVLAQGAATTRAVELLTAAVERQARMQRRLIAAALVVLLGIGWVLVDNHRAIRALQSRLCPLVTLSVPGPGQAPPATQHGRDVERAARQLAGTFGCTLPAATPR